MHADYVSGTRHRAHASRAKHALIDEADVEFEFTTLADSETTQFPRLTFSFLIDRLSGE